MLRFIFLLFLFMGKEHILTVPGKYEEIKNICRFIVHGAAEVGLDETAVFHVELACDEACTNIIEHAYGGENVGEINISWQVLNNMFVVTITDKGQYFDADDMPMPQRIKSTSQIESAENIRVGGLGLHFMRNLMDEVDFDTDPHHGNKLVMKKRLPTDKGAS